MTQNAWLCRVALRNLDFYKNIKMSVEGLVVCSCGGGYIYIDKVYTFISL